MWALTQGTNLPEIASLKYAQSLDTVHSDKLKCIVLHQGTVFRTLHTFSTYNKSEENGTTF